MRARVHLKQRPPWRRRKAALAPAGSPMLLEMRLENVFFRRPADRVIAGTLNDVQLHDLSSSSRSVHFARPRGGAETGQGDQLASFSPSKIRALAEVARCCASAAASNPLPPIIGASGTPCEAGFQRLHDLAVAPSFTRAGRIGLQQDTRLHQKLRGALAGADQFMQMPAFVAGQFHDVLFYAYLFGSHESPPVIDPGDGLTNQNSKSMTWGH